MLRSGTYRLRPAAAAAIVAACLLCGCASTGQPGPPATGSELPDWVRVVPRVRDGRAFYVGGCASAASAEAGIAAAEADAFSQIGSDARDHMREVILGAARGSDVAVSSTDRGVLQRTAGEALGESLSGVAAREQVYHRECGGPGAEAVCQVFVLVTVRLEIWDRAVLDVLERLAVSAREEGRTEVAELARFTARYYVPKAGAGR